MPLCGSLCPARDQRSLPSSLCRSLWGACPDRACLDWAWHRRLAACCILWGAAALLPPDGSRGELL